jgi:hypothetical protein
MRTNVQIYGNSDENAAKIPPELANLQEFGLSAVVGFMRMLAVGKLTIKPSFVGIKSVADISYKPLCAGAPEPLVKLRNTMVRNIAEIATMFGILEVELLPSEEELADLKATWEKISKPGSSTLGHDTAHVREINLNTEEDPTGEKVIDEEQETNV